MKIARLITTLNCNRNCHGCCNSYGRIMTAAMRIRDVEAVVGYPVVCVTGGEPLLEPDRTLDVVARLRRQHPQTQIYLYTSLWTTRLLDLIKVVDGVQFTLHYTSETEDPLLRRRDLMGLNDLQLHLLAKKFPSVSFRLNIDSRIGFTVPLVPSVWQRVRIMPWLSEDKLIEAQPNGIPAGETMFILED